MNHTAKQFKKQQLDNEVIVLQQPSKGPDQNPTAKLWLFLEKNINARKPRNLEVSQKLLKKKSGQMFVRIWYKRFQGGWR